MSDYFSKPGVNFSRLKAGSTSLRHLQHRLETPQDSTAAMELGTAIHLAVLEPNAFESVVIAPDAFVTAAGALSTGKDAKAWRAQLPDSATVLTQAQVDLCRAIAASVYAHVDAAEWLKHADLKEHEFFWTEQVDAAGLTTAVNCKGKADFVSTQLGLLGDLKSCSTGMRAFSPKWCINEIASRIYHAQAGMYSRGLAANGIEVQSFGWIFVESSAPHDVCVIEADGDMMRAGHDKAVLLLKKYAQGTVTGIWPGVAPRKVTGSLPKWATVEEDSGDEFAAWGF